MKYKFVASVIVLLVLLVFFFLFVFDKTGIVFTDDINNYNNESYPIETWLFPNAIPENANVVLFSYYQYYSEDVDVYLELRFDSTKEMENYLLEMKRGLATHISSKPYNAPHENGEYIIETNNIYNDLYVDIVSSSYHSSQNNTCFTGYDIEINPDRKLCSGYFGSISYSFEELTVIHSYFHGSFFESVGRGLPRYVSRFGVLSHGSHQRRFLLECE